MPLVVISGLPASGKSTRARELQTYLTGRDKKVHLVSENEAIPKAGFEKNAYYADSNKEKQVRSDLRSDVMRLLNKEEVVILDAGNYIKGYRYELFCTTKATRTTQCTLMCGIQSDRAWEFNEQRKAEETLGLETLDNSNVPYSREMFDALCNRFEEPHGNARWDSPLFVVFPDDKLPVEEIYAALYESKPLPPNQSTQNPPLSATNHLFDMDRITQGIIDEVLGARKVGIYGPIGVPGSQIKVNIPENYQAAHLNRLRRQFINYSKLHHTATSNLEKVPQLFVQFLNSNCNPE